MKILLPLVVFLTATSVSAKSDNVWRALAEEARNTHTVEQCIKDPSKFNECQARFSKSERAKFCGDFSLIKEISNNKISTAFEVITYTCLKYARY